MSEAPRRTPEASVFNFAGLATAKPELLCDEIRAAYYSRRRENDKPILRFVSITRNARAPARIVSGKCCFRGFPKRAKGYRYGGQHFSGRRCNSSHAGCFIAGISTSARLVSWILSRFSAIFIFLLSTALVTQSSQFHLVNCLNGSNSPRSRWRRCLPGALLAQAELGAFTYASRGG